MKGSMRRNDVMRWWKLQEIIGKSTRILQNYQGNGKRLMDSPRPLNKCEACREWNLRNSEINKNK